MVIRLWINVMDVGEKTVKESSIPSSPEIIAYYVRPDPKETNEVFCEVLVPIDEYVVVKREVDHFVLKVLKKRGDSL